MMQRRPLLFAAGLATLGPVSALPEAWLGDWRATLSHGGESTPFGLRLEPDDKQPGKLRVKVSAPAIQVMSESSRGSYRERAAPSTIDRVKTVQSIPNRGKCRTHEAGRWVPGPPSGGK